MALYALGDLHLALGAADKPMDVFGGKWTGYMEKLQENLSILCQEDTLVIVGDFCWALGLSEAEARLPLSFPISRQEALRQGQPRLLVEHGGEV